MKARRMAGSAREVERATVEQIACWRTSASLALLAPSSLAAEKGFDPDTMRLEDALAAAGVGNFQLRVWLLCGLAVTADGVEKAAQMYIFQGVSKAWGVEGAALGLLGSVSGLGQALGAYTFGRLSDARGRRASLLLALMVTFVVGSLCAVAPTFMVFLVLRFLVNVALGGALPYAFTLLAEFLPPNERPKWIPFLYAMYGVGRLITAAAAWGMLQHSWRLYVLVLALPCGVLLLLKGWIPESPHYLLVQEQPAQARRVIQDVAAANGVTLPFGPCTQLRCEEEPARAEHWFAVLQTTSAKLLCSMWFLTALGSTWFDWVLKVLQETGVPSSTAYEGLMFFNTNELVVPLILALLQRSSAVERARWPLAGASTAAFISLTAFALVVAAHAAPWLLMTLSVVASYCGIAVWVLHYTVTPSYFAAEVRGTGFGTCMSFNRLGYIIGPFVSSLLVTTSRAGLLLACAVCYLLLVVFAALLRNSPDSCGEEGETTHLAEVH